MRIGCQIGAWEQGSIQQVIAGMGAENFSGIELFDWHIGAFYEKPAQFKGFLDEAGMELAGVYFSSDKFIDPTGEKEALKKAKDACDFLREVGCRFLVMNGGIGRKEGQVFSDDDFKQQARIYNLIGEESRKREVQAVMHPHAHCMIESCDDLKKLLDFGLDQDLVGLTVHAGHQLVLGLEPYEMYEKYPGWVRYLHVGNTDAEGKGALLGEGVLDQERLHKPILEAGYDGWIIIECRKEGVSCQEYCGDARDYMKAQWPDANWQ